MQWVDCWLSLTRSLPLCPGVQWVDCWLSLSIVLFLSLSRCAVGDDWWYYWETCQYPGFTQDTVTTALIASFSVLVVTVVVCVWVCVWRGITRTVVLVETSQCSMSALQGCSVFSPCQHQNDPWPASSRCNEDGERVINTYAMKCAYSIVYGRCGITVADM